jgi:transcriptional regulator with XRE-family HTH domain
MGNSETLAQSIDERIGQRLQFMREQRGWPLEELARRSGVSRATLSRLENAEVSPTAQVLGKLCTAFGLTLSRLIFMAEDRFPALLPRMDQPVWTDDRSGFQRRSVSPPAQGLAGEVVECTLDASTEISYEQPPRPGLEHHLVMLDGEIGITVDGRTHVLKSGDCLRYPLHGPSRFATPEHTGARYFIFLV